jgi:hypothetical protein
MIRGHMFVNILYLPPPDCRRCDRQMFWPRTPLRFRSKDSRAYSGTRDVCGTCYHAIRGNPDELVKYPTRSHRTEDTYRMYIVYKIRHPRWTKREIAEGLMGMTYAAVDRAICRARKREREQARQTEEIAA